MTAFSVLTSAPSPWALAWRRYRRSPLGVIGGWLLIVLYASALFSPFLAPYNITTQHEGFSYQPPQRLHIIHKGHLRSPF
ncbi:MAG: ABC transporter permease, partial [Deinococcota bacterium]